jgi:subtilisin family serine protease
VEKLTKGITIIIVFMLFIQPVSALIASETVVYRGKATSPRALTSTSSTTVKESSTVKPSEEDYAEGEILIKYKKEKVQLNSSSGKNKARNFEASNSLERKETLARSNISVLRIKDGKTVKQKIADLKNDSNIEYAEPNYRRYPTAISTDDTHRALLWGLDNTGQTVDTVAGTSDADMDIPEAWSINEGTSTSVIVAVIDSGVAYNHPDLFANMWDGSSCVDENGDALGGCNYGYDYEDDDKTPLPTTSSHGTHVAGIIAAVKNNTKGIIGVAPSAEIMAIKFGFTVAEEVKAIDFAIENGAKVINASFGGTGLSQAEYDAIDRFRAAGGLFVTSAGNAGADNETILHYPSDHDLDNIIAVAATDQNDVLASFSNYGSSSVDVGAPGVNIYSTIANEVLANQTFEAVVPNAIPSGWVKSSTSNNWGTSDIGGSRGTVLYGDYANVPYVSNASTSVTSTTTSLSGVSSASMSFVAQCDTEYSIFLFDYMTIQISGDGTNFTGLDLGGYWGTSNGKFNEWYLDSDGSSSSSASHSFSEVEIPSAFLTDNFKIRLIWTTDGTLVSDEGCFVDDLKITTVNDGADEQYDYKDGTSMAAPHVAGLAALIEGYNPTLTYSEVKSTILTTGDSIASLASTTVSGKRVNALSALQSVTPGKAIVTFNFTSPSTTGSINEGAKTASLTVPYGTNVTALVPTITLSAGATLSPLSGVAQDFSSSTVYTVTAVDGTTQGYDVTVTEASPSTIATATSTSYTVSDGASTITGVPYSTTQAVFLAAMTKGEDNQTWDTADLSDPVVSGDTLVVTAQNGTTTKTYTLTVALNSAKNITSFSFTEGSGAISGTNIAVTVAYGTSVTALVPTIVTNGASSTSPLSGVAQNFSSPVDYTVTASDSSTQVYTVTVTVAVLSTVATTTSVTYTVSDDASTITGVPYSTTQAVFLAAMTKGEDNQTWDTTDLSDPVVSGDTLVVTAENGTTTKTYTLTVSSPSGGGGGSRRSSSPTSVTDVSTTTPEVSVIDEATEKEVYRQSLFAKVDELTKIIQVLQVQLAAKNNSPVATQPIDKPEVPKIVNKDVDVRDLQKKLNSIGFIVAASGSGSPGNETSYYGPATVAAVQKFQCQYDIVCAGTPETTGFGHFGPVTRIYLLVQTTPIF